MKAIAIDCGGVLFNNGTLQAIETLVRVYGYDEKVLRRALYSEESKLLRKGSLTEDRFVAWMDAHLPEEYDAQLVMNEWHDAFEIDPEMLQLVIELKIRHKLILFSVNVRERIAILERKYDFLKYFDAQVWSYDVGAEKRGSDAMYLALIKAAGCRPEEIAVVDDEEEVVARAAAHGMKGFRYRDARALRRALRDAGCDIVL